MLFTCLIQASDRYLTLQEAASGMHPELEAILTQFLHKFEWGTKITSEKFVEIGFQP